MKLAIYPGSFNPFHAGHFNIVKEAIKVFDKVIIGAGTNPEKTYPKDRLEEIYKQVEPYIKQGRVDVKEFTGLLKDFVLKEKVDAVIKGLRNTNDFLYEQTQQYWNEDLGISVPTYYIIADRNLVHVSSSAIKGLKK